MAHVFALALSVFIVYLARPGTSLFSWHPTFMIIGFGLFMFEAILIFSPQSSLLASSDRATKVKWHWILNILANVSIFLGFASIYYNKELNSKPHFTSWHGSLGLFSVLTTVLQSICAISLIYYNVKWLNPLGITLRLRKQLHAVFGALSYVVGYVTLLLSMYSNFMMKNTSDNSWYTLLVLMTVVASVIVNQVSAAYLVKAKPVTSASKQNVDGVTIRPVAASDEVKVKPLGKSKSPLLPYDYSPPIRRRNRYEGSRKATTSTQVTEFTPVSRPVAEETKKKSPSCDYDKEIVKSKNKDFDEIDSLVQSEIQLKKIENEKEEKTQLTVESKNLDTVQNNKCEIPESIVQGTDSLPPGDEKLLVSIDLDKYNKIEEEILKSEKIELVLETPIHIPMDTRIDNVNASDLITPPPSPDVVAVTESEHVLEETNENLPAETVQRTRFPRRSRKSRNMDGTIPWESIAL